MGYCKKCGAKNEEGNKHCEVCGAALEEETFEEITLKENAPEKAAPAGNERMGLAIASLICGIVSLLCGCGAGCLGFIGCGINFIVAGAAIACGVISLSQKRGGRNMAIAGLILSGLGLLLSIIGLFFWTSIIRSGKEPEWLGNFIDILEGILEF